MREHFEKSHNVKPDGTFRYDTKMDMYVAIDDEMQFQVENINDHWDTFKCAWELAKNEKH